MSRYQELIAEAEEIHAKRQTVGWDGYEADPITSQSLVTLKYVVNYLREDIMLPNVSPVCTGGYSLEWRTKTHYMVLEIEDTWLTVVCIEMDRKIPVLGTTIYKNSTSNILFDYSILRTINDHLKRYR